MPGPEFHSFEGAVEPEAMVDLTDAITQSVDWSEPLRVKPIALSGELKVTEFVDHPVDGKKNVAQVFTVENAHFQVLRIRIARVTLTTVIEYGESEIETLTDSRNLDSLWLNSLGRLILPEELAGQAASDNYDYPAVIESLGLILGAKGPNHVSIGKH